MPHVFLYVVELEGEEQGLRFEVADLEDKQHAARQIVVTVGHGAFLGCEAEELDALSWLKCGRPYNSSISWFSRILSRSL